MVLLYLKPLRAETTSSRVRCFSKPASALLMLGLWFALLCLSASDTLHRCLHDDAAQPGHDCLVTAFTKGTALDVPQAENFVQPVPEVIYLAMAEQSPHLQRIDLRLLSDRAPPVSLVLL
ncbi:MAG: hypothetical protein IPK15_11800 [Verrucomicrobia bacterium]|nr:hypothetical protein [Verrucomicrobiota bacterium]